MKALGAKEAAEKAEIELAEVEKALKNTPARSDALKGLYNQARWTIRELAFANPKLYFDEVVFVKRQWPSRNHQCSHRVGEAQIPGANICVLKGLSPDGEVREILDAEKAKGGVGRFDLSYDAKSIVFPYAKPRNPPTGYGYGKPGLRSGRAGNP